MSRKGSRSRAGPTLSGQQAAREAFPCNLGGTAVMFLQAVPWNVPWGGFLRPTSSHFWEDTMKELAKQYDPSQVEDRIYQFWQDGG